MARNTITLRYNLRTNKNTKSKSYGKYFAEVDRRNTLSTRGLARHISEHNSSYGEDVVLGLLNKLSKCIPELVGQGVGVKLDGIGTFYPTLQNKAGGADSPADFTGDMIERVHVRFTPDGSQLDNITSKVFREKCSLEAANVIETTGSTATHDLHRTFIPIADWLAQHQGNGPSDNPGGGDNNGGDDDQPIVNP
jgi:predicted histone-like DNA-binding protein